MSRTRTMRNRATFMALVAIVSLACEATPKTVPRTVSPSIYLGSLGKARCAPGAAFGLGGLQETGLDTNKGSSWALVFGPLPPPAGKDVKIVWRMTGSGAFAFRATDDDGNVAPLLGQQPHGFSGSNWIHPGYEVGTGFNFPHSGCWDVHVARSDVDGDLWLLVGAASSASVRRTTTTD